MLKLIKYELRKTWFTKLILLAVTAVAEIIYLAGLYGDRENTMAVGMFTLLMLAVCGVAVMGLESVFVLHRDMNTKQSYMLFMTPNSCYKILGAKVLECGASILIAGAFFFALGVLDITLLFAKQGQLSVLWKEIQTIFSSLSFNGRNLRIDTASASAFCFAMLANWISLVTTAYLADVISSALLNGRKYNGFISFILFLALNYAINKLITLVTGGIADTVTLMWISGLCGLVMAAAMYFVTARIMDKYLSV